MKMSKSWSSGPSKYGGQRGVMVRRRDECADGAASTAWGKLRLPGGHLLNRGFLWNVQPMNECNGIGEIPLTMYLEEKR